ncbi:MAG: UDP-N-acetylmuramoyl-L-alanyl-D-glutamate--2,6-diaminopimelate ligase, partial [Firmicutes bacterium HGW-Firmicutes-21]
MLFMKLKEILTGIIPLNGSFDTETEIKDIVYDSRNEKVGSDILFVCLSGFQSDGHSYAKSVYDKGVRVFAAQKPLELPEDATVIYVENTRKFLALASANLFGNPTREIFTIGVTGTKGKTSTCYMIKSIFEAYGKKVGIMGTIGIFYGDTYEFLGLNTPESYDIHKHTRGMVDAGCDVMIMEASSQGFLLNRTYGIIYDVGVFTNLSPDHIGASEHKDFDDYINCKKLLFRQSRIGFTNKDNEYYEHIIDDADCPVKTFSVINEADYRAVEPIFSSDESNLKTEFTCIEKTPSNDNIKTKIELNTPGYFSLYNAVAAIAVARNCGIPYIAVKDGLKKAFIKGRMEIVPIYQPFTV